MMAIDIEKIRADVEIGKTDSMTVSEYKTCILAFLFYRYLSEHQEQYLAQNNVLELSGGVSVNDAYAAEAKDEYLWSHGTSVREPDRLIAPGADPCSGGDQTGVPVSIPP